MIAPVSALKHDSDVNCKVMLVVQTMLPFAFKSIIRFALSVMKFADALSSSLSYSLYSFKMWDKSDGNQVSGNVRFVVIRFAQLQSVAHRSRRSGESVEE